MLWADLRGRVWASVLPGIFHTAFCPDGPFFDRDGKPREWSRATLPEEAGEDSIHRVAHEWLFNFGIPARPWSRRQGLLLTEPGNDGFGSDLRHLSLVKNALTRIDVPIGEYGPGPIRLWCFRPIWEFGSVVLTPSFDRNACLATAYVVAAIHHPGGFERGTSSPRFRAPAEKCMKRTWEIRRRANDARFSS